MYVTLEPCSHHGRTPPCIDAVINAGISRVVIAMGDPNPLVNGQGITALQKAGITVDMCDSASQAQARALNPGFISQINRKRPWIIGKIGMSLDGRTAMKSGESQWITSDNARSDVHRWRARAGAIVTTATTVLKDDARMTVRSALHSLPVGVSFQQPLRVIIDKDLTLSPEQAILHQEGQSLLVIRDDLDNSTEKQHAFLETLKRTGNNRVQFLSLPIGSDQHLVLKGLWDWLTENQIATVFIEAGSTFMGGMIQAKEVDELLVYIAPKCLGHEGMPMMVLPGLTQLNQHIPGQFQEIVTFDPDLRLRVTFENA